MNHGLTFYDYYDTVNWVKYLYVVLLTESLSYTFFFSIDSEKTHQDFKYDGRPIYKQNISTQYICSRGFDGIYCVSDLQYYEL